MAYPTALDIAWENVSNCCCGVNFISSIQNLVWGSAKQLKCSAAKLSFRNTAYIVCNTVYTTMHHAAHIACRPGSWRKKGNPYRCYKPTTYKCDYIAILSSNF